ncbi:acyl-CoA dehydrogenase [Peribacillus cavernae]|uniref:Acyl-CoA dehydrogenase n=1 Tax=Peribacillus cavernae TaxID=1674310 RepID=A0A3S0VWV3_9BACI|nr:acyl-CoA dehydrogenase family protein [Peribacillus cavernae]MDQ0219256.1 alkylation response protein AidB-like acyl-CoA dehydrogenase [Peribacillus cavernae]RUQ27846.1 acyl-CoA dehydrogenase [Peribacillus cavernae]
MNDISQIIKETAEKIMEDLCTKQVVEDSELGILPRELWKTIVKSGMATVGVSEEAGGSGGSFADALTILRIAAKFSAPIPIAETLMANWVLSEAGLPLMEKPTTIASNNNGNKMMFIEISDGWTISGSAYDVPYARYAEAVVVIGNSQQGNMVAIVNPRACHIEHEQNLAGEARDHLYINNVHLQGEAVSRVREGNDNNLLYRGALIRAVQMTGALERILELSIAYSKERIQFGRPIAKFQAIQQQIAILAGEVSSAKTITNLAVKSFEAGNGEKQIMAAKIRVGEAASLGAPIAHQIHGAIGFTDEHSLQQSTRRLWSWRDEFGNESYWANKLGNEVLNTGPDYLWPFVTSMNSELVL